VTVLHAAAQTAAWHVATQLGRARVAIPVVPVTVLRDAWVSGVISNPAIHTQAVQLVTVIAAQ
jgi:hypothetical protein